MKTALLIENPIRDEVSGIEEITRHEKRRAAERSAARYALLPLFIIAAAAMFAAGVLAMSFAVHIFHH